MKVVFSLDETARIATVSLDGPLTGDIAMEFLPLIDGVMVQMCLQGWTFLLGSRSTTPTVMDPQTVAQKLAHRAWMAQQGPPDDAVPEPPPPGGMHQPAPVPNPAPSVDPNLTPQQRLTALFRGWVGDTTPPGEDPSEPPANPPTDGPDPDPPTPKGPPEPA